MSKQEILNLFVKKIELLNRATKVTEQDAETITGKTLNHIEEVLLTESLKQDIEDLQLILGEHKDADQPEVDCAAR